MKEKIFDSVELCKNRPLQGAVLYEEFMYYDENDYQDENLWTQEEIEQFEYETNRLAYLGLSIQDFL